LASSLVRPIYRHTNVRFDRRGDNRRLAHISSSTQTLIGVFRFYSASKWRWLIALGLFFLAIVGWNVWDSIHRGEGYYHIVFGALALVLGVLFFLLMFILVKAGKLPDAAQVMYAMVVIITSTVCFGQWLAYSVSGTSVFDQDVTLKSETLNDVKVILVMSRNTILLKGKVIYVVPTADINKFQTASKP
jgi:hypothetical protein